MLAVPVPCSTVALLWLQVRPRGSAGWESSLRQKPPVRLIFQAGQTRHEMRIKEPNSVEMLRDLPAPLRVSVRAGAGVFLELPCSSAVPWLRRFRHIAASLCLSFPCEVEVCAVACPG